MGFGVVVVPDRVCSSVSFVRSTVSVFLFYELHVMSLIEKCVLVFVYFVNVYFVFVLVFCFICCVLQQPGVCSFVGLWCLVFAFAYEVHVSLENVCFVYFFFMCLFLMSFVFFADVCVFFLAVIFFFCSTRAEGGGASSAARRGPGGARQSSILSQVRLDCPLLALSSVFFFFLGLQMHEFTNIPLRATGKKDESSYVQYSWTKTEVTKIGTKIGKVEIEKIGNLALNITVNTAFFV